MPTLTGCSVAPEPRAVYAPSATTLAKVRLDPVAATAKLNAYRAEKGLNPLLLDPALTAMAERQAQAMAQSGTMSHDVAGSLSARLAKSLGTGYGAYWAMEVGAEPRTGRAPVAVWLFPLPIVVIEPR
jgi:uncharacterized protein YkwD